MDPDESALSAEDFDGVPLAARFAPGRHVMSEPVAAGFDMFSRGTTSGTLVQGETRRQLLALLTEGRRRRNEPDVLSPEEIGIPPAGGF